MRTAIPLIPEVLAGAPMGHAGAGTEVTATVSAGKAGATSPVERRGRARAEAGAARTAGEPSIAVTTLGAAGEPASAAERRTVTVPMSAEGEARAVTRTSSAPARTTGPVVPIAASPAFATAAGARTGATRTRAVPVGTIAVRPVPFRAFAVRTVSVRTAAGAAVVVAGFGPPRRAIPRLGPHGLQGTDREGGRHQEQE